MYHCLGGIKEPVSKSFLLGMSERKQPTKQIAPSERRGRSGRLRFPHAVK
jgi:hypothetical protein